MAYLDWKDKTVEFAAIRHQKMNEAQICAMVQMYSKMP